MTNKDYFKAYRAANREKLIVRKRTYYKLNGLKIKEGNRKYYQVNTDKCKALTKEWQTQNPEKLRFYNANRRAAKLKRTPKWLTKEQWIQIRSFYELAQTLTVQTGVRHEVDHVVPLRGDDVSGLHVPWNLQILTKSENCQKSNK